MDVSNIEKLVYRFIDASVPPQYHRSYTITVTAGSAAVVVDSYGDILAEKSYPMAAGEFRKIKQSFAKHDIRNCPPVENSGCTGGTSEKIACFNQDEKIFSGSVYHCGGKDMGDICGNIRGFARDIMDLIPDLKKMIQ